MSVLSANSAAIRGLVGFELEMRGDSREEDPDSIEFAVIDELRAPDCKSAKINYCILYCTSNTLVSLYNRRVLRIFRLETHLQ